MTQINILFWLYLLGQAILSCDTAFKRVNDEEAMAEAKEDCEAEGVDPSILIVPMFLAVFYRRVIWFLFTFAIVRIVT